MRRLLALALGAVAGTACTGDGGVAAGDTAANLSGADSIAAVKTYRTGDLVIENVVAPAPVPTSGGPSPIAVYFVVRNEGATADTLDGIEITAGTASLHQQTGAGGAMEVKLELGDTQCSTERGCQTLVVKVQRVSKRCHPKDQC